MDPEDPSLRFPRLRRWLRRLAIGFACFAVLGAIALLVYHIVVGQRWKRFERELAEVTAAMPYVAPSRVSLLEPHVPGNAWDGYLAAFILLPAGKSPGEQAAYAILRGEGKPEDEELARAWAGEGRQAVNRFLEAARCEGADGRDCVREKKAMYRMLTAGWSLHYLILLDARFHFDEGDRAGAILRLAAIAQFALDLARIPDAIGSRIGAMMLEDHLRQYVRRLTDPVTTPNELTEIARLCESIERNLPTSSETCALAIAGEGLESREIPADPHPWYRVHQLLQSRPYHPLLTRAVFAARGFSIRAAIVERWDAGQRRKNAAVGAESTPYGEVCAALNREFELRRTAWNPLMHLEWYPMPDEFAIRRVRARCRLLRAAVQIRSGLAPTNPDWPVDPFSLKPIGYRTVGDRIVLWSEGQYGDQGGIGEWDDHWGRCDLVLVLAHP